VWAVALLGSLATSSSFTILGWVVVEKTGSPFQVSLIAVLFMVPQLFAGPVGGALADRIGRARLLRGGLSMRACLAAALAASLVVVPEQLWPVYALHAIAATVAGTTIPARRALVADVVDRETLTNAISLDELALTTSFMAGPFIAGPLLLIVQPGYLFIGCTVMYALAAFAVPRTPAASESSPEPSSEPEQPVSFRESMLLGFRYLRGSRLLMAVFAIGVTTEMLAFTFFPLIPSFVTDVFRGGPGLLGAIQGTAESGAVVASLLVAAWAVRVVRPARLMVLGMFGSHAVAILLGVSTVLAVTFPMIVVIGLFAGVGFLMQSNVILTTVPRDLRARVLGVQQMAWGAGAVGGLMAGALASAFTLKLAVIAPAVAGLVLILVITAFAPELWREPASETEPPTDRDDT